MDPYTPLPDPAALQVSVFHPRKGWLHPEDIPDYPLATWLAKYVLETYPDLSLYQATKPAYNVRLILDPDVDVERKHAALIRLLTWQETVLHPHPSSRNSRRNRGGRPGLTEDDVRKFERTLEDVVSSLWQEPKGPPTQLEVMGAWPTSISERWFYDRWALLRQLRGIKDWKTYRDRFRQ